MLGRCAKGRANKIRAPVPTVPGPHPAHRPEHTNVTMDPAEVLFRPNSCERTNTWPYITGSVLLQSSFYEGRAHHHVTKIIHDHPLARPLIQVEEFAASGHHILHIWAHQSAALWS